MKTFKKFLLEQQYYGIEATGCVIYAQDTNRVLFLKRSNTENSEIGQWEFTIGGKKDEEDIDAKDSVKREVFEEIGKLTQIISFDIIDIFYDSGDDNKPFKYFTYFVKVGKEFIPELSEEHSDYRWIDINSDILPEPRHFGFDRLIERIKTLI